MLILLAVSEKKGLDRQMRFKPATYGSKVAQPSTRPKLGDSLNYYSVALILKLTKGCNNNENKLYYL